MKNFIFFLILLLPAVHLGLTMAQRLPLVIPSDSLQLWLKADAGADTLNGTVSRWHDQSGEENDAVQPSASRQPQFLPDSLNGKPVLHFDGVDDKLGLTGSTPMSQFTIFMVVKNYAPVPGQEHSDHVMAFGSPTGEGYFVLFGGLERISDRINIGGPLGAVRATAANIAKYGEWRIISIVTDKKIYSTTLRWNGSNAVVTPDGIGSNVSISVPMGAGGGIGGADNSPFGYLLTAHCDFAETIVYNRVVTDSERTAVEDYLANKYNISKVTGVENSKVKVIPKQFTLSQNYPNPFNPSTKIDFAIPKSSFVNLTVFNVLGEEVATLVNETKAPGNYEVNYSAANLPSGIYIYKLQAGSFRVSKKMILLQ